MSKNSDILVVDDEIDIIDFIVEVLQDEGYTVRSATTVETALAAIASRLPALVLLDIIMPGRGSDAIISYIRDQAPTISIVAITATPQSAEPLLGQGIEVCIAKPFDIDTLLTCVAHYMLPALP